MTTPDGIKINEATVDEKPVLRQLLELYGHDFSEFEGTDVGPHGFFGYKYLDHYWTEPHRHPYLIRVDDQLAGFALVRRAGTGGEETYSLCEFFVMRKYRKRGVGGFAAAAVFDQWNGKWEVSQVAAHPGSTSFWRKVIGRYTAGRFEERQEAGSGPTQLFDSPGHAL